MNTDKRYCMIDALGGEQLVKVKIFNALLKLA
jgi:hypothetical protein